MSDLETFKIQRPLAGAMGEALVYNRDRSITTFLPIGRELRRLFREHGNPPKLYVRAGMKGGGRVFAIQSVVDPEAW